MTGADANLEPGEVLGETYRIVRRIAAGGFGIVYEARHVRLQERRVAIKVLVADRAASEEFLPRFRREAEIGAGLNHPNIVQVTDWDTLPSGLPYFVMEYLEGVSLGERMRASHIPRELVLHIVRGIGAALEVAHSRGIIHRDLKPSNVFLTDPTDATQKMAAVKVLDFGISKLVTDQTLRTSSPKLLGTPRYMAPEQAKGLAVTPAADQFSLAAMTYEMYAGEPPFRGDTLESIVYRVVHERAAPLEDRVPGLEPHIVSTIERAMSKNPEQRFVNIRDFLDSLDGKEPQGDKDRLATTAQMNPEINVAEVSSARPLPATLDQELKQTAGHRWASRVGIGMLILSGLGIFLATRGPFGGEKTTTTATTVAAATTVPDTPAATVSTEDELQPTATPDKTPATSTATAVTPVALVEETEAARTKLDRVAKLYADGKYRSALRTARQSLIVQETPRGHRYITLCHCALSDLGNAKASFFRVAKKDRKAVQAECGRLGVDL